MKIKVIASSGPHFTIPFPTALVSSPTVVNLWLKYVRKYATAEMPELSQEHIHQLCSEIKRIKKTYKTWELVHVESANGDLVSITL